VCPSCRGEFEAPVRWKVCRKRKELRAAQARKTAANSRKPHPHGRLEDLVACYKCRKRFDYRHPPCSINDNLAIRMRIPKILEIGERERSKFQVVSFK